MADHIKYVRARTSAIAEQKARGTQFKVVRCRKCKSAKKYHGMNRYACVMRRKKNTRGPR